MLLQCFWKETAISLQPLLFFILNSNEYYCPSFNQSFSVIPWLVSSPYFLYLISFISLKHICMLVLFLSTPHQSCCIPLLLSLIIASVLLWPLNPSLKPLSTEASGIILSNPFATVNRVWEIQIWCYSTARTISVAHLHPQKSGISNFWIF